MTTWRGIDEFVAVATAGTFAGGAKAMDRSTTHMSRAIARLEARLQAPLLHRTTRMVRLTDTGRIFLEHCQRIIVERDEAIALVSERGEPQGELRLTCSTAMGERFVAPIVRRYAIEHPKLSVTIELSNRLVDLVAEGFDLAVRTGNLSDSRLIGTRVASRTLYTCAAPSYLAAAPGLTAVNDLTAHECLIGTASTWHFKVGNKELIYRPGGRWRCNSGAAIIDAALAGLGVCQLPDFYVLPHLASGELVPVLSAFQADDEPIWAVYPQRRHLLPKVRNVVDYLRRDLGPAMAGDHPSI